MATSQPIEFYRHNLGREEKARIVAALDRPILTTGQAVAEAEQALADYLGIAQVVCLDSCTAALHLALTSLGVGPGDHVIVPAMTFVATANAVLMAGAEPVFADVDPATGCLTPDTVLPRLTPRTRAIIPVHLYGQLCDMAALNALAQDHNLFLIEDSAHCIEARRGSVRPGSHSRGACLSFYATKNITCGEGGAFATNDADLAERVRRLSLHGMTTSAYDRYDKPYQHWDMPTWGWKYNLDDIRASLLLPQIHKLDEQWRRRIAIAAHYEAAFGQMDDVDHPRVSVPEWSARHLFPIWVPPARRNDIVAALQERQIGVVVNYRAAHLLEFYARQYGYRHGDLPVAESIGDRTLSIPFYTQLTDEQVRRVIDAVGEAVRESGKPCGVPLSSVG